MTESPVEYPPLDESTIAPSRRGIPDLYNYLPSRFIPLAEAKARKWSHFYLGALCRRGHQAPRYVTNPDQCVDCVRAKIGRELIGAPTAAVVRKAKVSESAPAPVAPILPEGASFEWTEEKRQRLIEVWVDTGAIANGREAIGVTPSEYRRELDRNEAFKADVERAGPLADQMLEEQAYALALKGNDKLLTKILAAKFPTQYRESIKVDVTQNTIHRLGDREIDARLSQLMGKFKDPIDVEFVEPKLLT